MSASQLQVKNKGVAFPLTPQGQKTPDFFIPRFFG